MFANNFKSSSANQTLLVHNQEQDPEEGYLSDSEDMVNLGELTAEQRLEIVELRRFQEERRLEIVGLHQQHHAEIARLQEERRLEIVGLHQQHHAEITRLHEERHLEITGLSKPEILLAAIVAAVLLVFAAGLLGTF